MDKLMKELMAEALRVQNLETEVKRSCEKLDRDVQIGREEKLNEIVKFLGEMSQLVAISCPNNTIHVKTCGRYKDGFYNFKPLLEFSNETIWLSGAETARVETDMIRKTKPYRYLYQMVLSFIDEWTEETQLFTEQTVAEKVRKHLAQRVDSASEKLNQSNNQHAKYFGE